MQALIGRAQARIALRDTEGAGKDIEQAHSLEREDANGLCEYGIVLRSRGSLNEAIEVLRRAAAVGGRDDTDYHLAVTLRERDEPGDLQEAAELLMRSIAQPDAIPAGDFPFAVAAAVEALATARALSRRRRAAGVDSRRAPARGHDAYAARQSQTARRANSIRPRSSPTRLCPG